MSDSGRADLWRIPVALALAAAAVRALVMLVLPDQAMSNDVGHWAAVAKVLARGGNPYAATEFLNWPPFWMQCIYVLSKVAAFTGIEFANVVRYFLIGVDAINIGLAAFVAMRFLGVVRPQRVVFAALVVNPAAVFLVCQHGNFDVLMVTALLGFLIALLRFRESGEMIDWIAACFALGIAILIKTVPLVLTPLLAFRIGMIPRRARLLGVAILLTPVMLGVSILYSLTPHEVTANVLRYRSYAGWFGITGVLEIASLPEVSRMYARVFPLLVLATLAVIAVRLARANERTAHQLILSIALLMTALIALGPGYGAQYIAWPLTFLALSYFGGDAGWRRDLRTALSVAALTYVVEYAIVPPHGHFLVRMMPGSAALWRASDIMSSEQVLTLVRLPLWAVMLWLAASGFRRLRAEAA